MATPLTQTGTEAARLTSPVRPHTVQATIIGAVLGALVWYGVGGLLMTALFGENGYIVQSPEEGSTAAWAARVMTHWINLFSLIAFGIATMLLFDRGRYLRVQQRAFQLDLIGPESQTLILPEDALNFHKRLGQVGETERSLLLFQLLQAGLQRARANWSAQDVADAVKTQSELSQGAAESEYSTVRYLVGAIPSIGFIGTVLGIGQAMAAMRMDNSTDSSPIDFAATHLSSAFDTTFVALVLSLIAMFALHRVQSAEDALMVRATDWCMQRFVFRMHISKGAE